MTFNFATFVYYHDLNENLNESIICNPLNVSWKKLIVAFKN